MRQPRGLPPSPPPTHPGSGHAVGARPPPAMVLTRRPDVDPTALGAAGRNAPTPPGRAGARPSAPDAGRSTDGRERRTRPHRGQARTTRPPGPVALLALGGHGDATDIRRLAGRDRRSRHARRRTAPSPAGTRHQASASETLLGGTLPNTHMCASHCLRCTLGSGRSGRSG